MQHASASISLKIDFTEPSLPWSSNVLWRNASSLDAPVGTFDCLALAAAPF
jgi:hypothetical protein